MKVYIITMYRWGDYNNHSYILGVYDNLEKATKAADDEADYRGGKYEAEVLELSINSSIDIEKPKKIYHTKPLFFGFEDSLFDCQFENLNCSECENEECTLNETEIKDDK